jgi:hypothetical protein
VEPARERPCRLQLAMTQGWVSSKTLQHHTPQMLDMEHQDLMFASVFLWSNPSLLFSYSSFLEWKYLLCVILSWKYITFFSILQEIIFIAKYLLWVSVETLDLDFWVIVKLLRLLLLVEIN